MNCFCRSIKFCAFIECTNNNPGPVELHTLASGTSHMCTQRGKKNMAYTASDFYYSAVVVLVERGLLHGHISRSYQNTKDPVLNGDWVGHSKKLAAQVGLCDPSRNVSKADIQHLKHLLSCEALHKQVDLEMPASLCIGASKLLINHANAGPMACISNHRTVCG